MISIIFILLFRIDHNAPTVDTFDMIEVNHKFNEWGACQLDQVITWDFHKEDHKFHVEWWKNMRDARKKTKEGEAKWLKKRREIADKIKVWETRKSFLANTDYRGEFIGGKLMPKKNHRTGYWEIKIQDENRIIRSKSFSETYSAFDPEIEDRKEHPTGIRRGLSMTREQIEAQRRREKDAAEHAQEIIDAIEPLLENLR